MHSCGAHPIAARNLSVPTSYATAMNIHGRFHPLPPIFDFPIWTFSNLDRLVSSRCHFILTQINKLASLEGQFKTTTHSSTQLKRGNMYFYERYNFQRQQENESHDVVELHFPKLCWEFEDVKNPMYLDVNCPGQRYVLILLTCCQEQI